MRIVKLTLTLMSLAGLSACALNKDEGGETGAAFDAKACAKMVAGGFRPLADEREKRFLGKVEKDAAVCRGGAKALARLDTPWVDWANYWSAGDDSSKDEGSRAYTLLGKHLKSNGRGIDGALLDLEYQRVELIKFNLFDNSTYEDYVRGRGRTGGRALKVWDEMRLPRQHPRYAEVGGDGRQICRGELIRARTPSGICNDIKNPLMGSTGTAFARNVAFESTFPRFGDTELARNRHGERLGLLTPDPQVISRRLFTREQADPQRCRDGHGLPGEAKAAQCDYQSAPFFNVLAAFWIQFMTHDWFSHLEEGRNQPELMRTGCERARVYDAEQALAPADVAELGCRPGDRVEKALVAQAGEPPAFTHDGKSHLSRAAQTSANSNTAWWDASQIYGYDELSQQRVKRDLDDPAKLLMVARGRRHGGEGERYGYLPLFKTCKDKPSDAACTPDPIAPQWSGQEAVAFPDNWTLGMSFYHNLFAREHNSFVDAFRAQMRKTPQADSGLRDPNASSRVIRYADVSDEELFQVARLVVSAEIAKIHTIEWTTQLLYDEPLYLALNANWNGLFEKHETLTKILERVVQKKGRSTDEDKATQWYSIFASGPGIFGLGSEIRKAGKDVWSLDEPDHVNGGVNHFGSPFNFPEEFVTVYRLHPLVPDLIEYREWDNDPNMVRKKLSVADSFRDKATAQMDDKGIANVALSLGRQRLGALTLNNHPAFLQNLDMPHLDTPTNKVDVAALDLIRDREHGVPRFNEFRRQIGLKQLTSFDDFIDQRLPADSPARKAQERLVEDLIEVYGQHECDASKIITDAQLNDDGTPIDDCLGHADGTLIDNIEDLDTVVGWLAESTRPHGFAISETQFHIFILNASRRLFSDRFFTSSFRPEFYTHLGVAWVNDNGPDGPVLERGASNGHEQPVSPLKRVLLRNIPELREELEPVVNVFDPWARDRGSYYSLEWKPRPGAETDESFM